MGRHYSLSGRTLDTRLSWSLYINQVRKRTAQGMGTLGPLLNSKSDLPIRTQSCYISSSSGPWWTMRAPRRGPLPAPMSGSYRRYNPSVFASLLVPPGTYVTGRYTRIWEFRCLSTTSQP